MTEITASNRFQVVDPIAFFLALVGAPLVVAVLGFWIMLIPVVGIVLGGPYYLILGTPILLAYLLLYEPKPWIAALLATVAVLLLLGGAHLLQARLPTDLLREPMYLYFGPPCGAAWGAAFVWLYRWIRQDIFKPDP
ncbi:hypothetical protein [Thalassococcus sp. S3]|uniref:hypothetical protein n=1 Tax=Thalassococcus sp. S3 TaxID=2017482 RepID=UPI0010242A0C|nr:hypothetical protein [Thalassococcus sp. S3]QBF33560.1 hypothetical protein CFI11_20430 [Thalassococcus sp. S3]